jgi:hypothetical protein
VTWIVVGLALWLALVVLYCCLLGAAGRGDRRT